MTSLILLLLVNLAVSAPATEPLSIFSTLAHRDNEISVHSCNYTQHDLNINWEVAFNWSPSSMTVATGYTTVSDSYAAGAYCGKPIMDNLIPTGVVAVPAPTCGKGSDYKSSVVAFGTGKYFGHAIDAVKKAVGAAQGGDPYPCQEVTDL